MQKRKDVVDTGSWAYAEELLERGDPVFVTELRRITDADRLGSFAARWYADRRPASRQLLFTYLDQPLNAFRHEALIKRLFKLAETAGDDEVMGAFLVLFDRSLRRKRTPRRQGFATVVPDKAAADALVKQWRQQGFQAYCYSNWAPNPYIIGRQVIRGFRVTRSTVVDALRVPDETVMWRPRDKDSHGPYPIAEEVRDRLEQRFRLFSLSTRRYLRRRAWRYFRKLGKQHPERYVAAVTAALKRYQDDDVADGVALIDNWGLIHILFHHSPVLVSRRTGWALAPDGALSRLQPAPIYEALWKQAPRALLDLVLHSHCRPVRQWALFMIRRDHAGMLHDLSPEELFGLLANDDPNAVALACELLRTLSDISVLGVDRLLGLVENPNPETLDLLCELLSERLGAERVSFSDAVRLAGSRPLPAARLGFTWLQSKAPSSEEDCRALLALAEAQAEPLRADLVRWVRGVLSASPHFQSEWLMEFLDSRHEEVRAEGWRWLQAEPRARDNPEIWRKLLESPYDDVRSRLVAELEKRVARQGSVPEGVRLDAELLRFLWASVLLNIHRGSRVKPVVVGQLVRRANRYPAEAAVLLPILAVALRSVRGPEWRAGLVGVVGLVERNSDLQPLVQRLFPELMLEGVFVDSGGPSG
jgi:hypothetical protein